MRNVTVSRFVIFASVVLMLSGCGTNIFKGLDSTSHGTSAEQARDAADKGDYTVALEQANKVLENGNSTVEEKIDAKNIIGGSILAKNGITVLDLGARLLEFDKGTVSTADVSNANDNIVAALQSIVSTISPEDVAAAADAFNDAADLQSTLGTESVGPRIIVPQIVVPKAPLLPSLNSSAQFRRAFANGTVVVKMITRYLDVDVSDSGTIALNITAIAESITARDVLVYLTTSPRTVVYYANNCIDALQKSKVFTTAQQDPLLSLQESVRKLLTLRTASDLSEGTYTGSSGTYSVGTSVPTNTRNTAILNAMNDIFKNTLRK